MKHVRVEVGRSADSANHGAEDHLAPPLSPWRPKSDREEENKEWSVFSVASNSCLHLLYRWRFVSLTAG